MGRRRARPNGRDRTRPNETETNRAARERERGGRERGEERKYNQFINKLSRALPNVRARSGYIQVPPPWPSTSDLPTNILCFHILLPFAPCLVSVSRYRTGAQRRSALLAWWCGVAVCYVARWCRVAVRYVARGCGVTVCYVARWCGIAVRYVARGCGVAVRYIAWGCGVAGCCAVAGAQGYDTIGVTRCGHCAIVGRCSVQVHDATVLA